MILLSNMQGLKWSILIVLFYFSLSLSTGSYQSAFEDSSSEIRFDYESTVDDLTTETAYDYQSTIKDSTSQSSISYEEPATESIIDYEYVFTDLEPENAFVSSDIKNLFKPPYDRDCPVHEHWEYCLGLCQRNCTNWSKALICPDICVQGCICDWGFTRGPEGNCIPVSECPPIEDEEPVKINVQFKCRRNEHFSSCNGHEECQKSCSNYDEEISCVSTCQPGCICDEGFVRGRTGKCIPIVQCRNPLMPPSIKSKEPLPRFCQSNEHFSPCNGLPMCQKSCSNYNESIICPLICVPGCVCDKGFVVGSDGKCVPLEQCPFEKKSILTQDNFFVCPNNEHRSSCSESPECQKSCTNMDSSISCPSTCVLGCVCDEGYVRGPDRSCIPIEKCPRLKQYIPISVAWQEGCPLYAHYSYCNGHKQCQKTCSRHTIPYSCEGLCFFGCVCDDGFVRSEVGGDCIREEQCPSVKSNSYQESNQPQSSKSLKSESKKNEIFSEVSSTDSSDTKRSRPTNRWNLIFGNTNEVLADTPSTVTEELQPFTVSTFDHGCPIEESCHIECKSAGHEYGICIGSGYEKCLCL